MASSVTAEEHSNTKTEEGTTAFHKKRSRRVSFAEITSVHIFDRDEEIETPPDPEPPSPPYDGGLGCTENEDDDDMDELGPTSPFIRVIRSPSSGGSTIGSATSNDEDNFFGPVSTSFIRLDLSDSAASDDNHDQTMDSTAFSMHFNSIAGSDSGELKTSTRTHISFEEKTPTPSSIPSNTRISMLLTLVNKPNCQPDVSTSKLSTGSQSNDMSLVGEYHDNKYDYGKLLPAFDQHLAEDHNDLHVDSHISVLKSPTEAGNQKENRPDLMDFNYAQDNNMQGTTSHEERNGVVTAEHNELGMGYDGPELLPSKQIVAAVLFNTCGFQAFKPMYPNQTIKEPIKDAFRSSSSLEFLATAQGTPLNHMNMVHQLDDIMDKENRCPLVRSITQLTDRPSHMLLNGVSQFESPGTVTPSNNQASALKSRTIVSSLRKSVSKLRILEASPFFAALNAKLEDSNSRSLVGLSKRTPLNDLSGKERAFTNMDDNKTTIKKNLVPIFRKENFAQVATQLVLPSENTWPGKHLQRNISKSADIGYGYKDVNKIGSPQIFNTSSNKLIDATVEKVSVQPIQHNESLIFGPGHVRGPGESISKARHFTIASHGMDSLYIKGRENFIPLNIAGSNMEEMVHEHGRNGFLYNAHNNSETRWNLNTLSDNPEHESFQSISRGSGIFIGQMKASIVSNGRVDEKSCQKNLADLLGRSPSNKEMYSLLQNESIDSHAENVQASCSNQLSNRDVSSGCSAERKRKTEHAITDKIAKVKRSSDSTLKLQSNTVVSSTGPNQERLAEIHTRFFKDTKLLPHSVDKMNLHGIDRLVGILGQLQRSKIYQLLSDEFQHQTVVDPGCNIRDKRRAETKLILGKFVHEQAKLQLMHVTREMLLKNVQSLSSVIQESEELKLNHSPKNSVDIQLMHRAPSLDRFKDIEEILVKCQVDDNVVNSMRQEINDINRRISSLTKSLHRSYNMKGEPNVADTNTIANNHLIKRAHCQIIRKDLQLWVIDDLKSNKDHHNVVLNYLDLMFQRLTVTAGVVPSISISIILNQMNIQRKFKDMDASTAFEFVFDAGVIQKHVSTTRLLQETQIISSLLGNLVDVMEEIQLARIELKNLIYARFRTSLDDSLDLELYFCDLNTRKKTAVTLNTSCLKRGIYPSEIVARQIDIPVDESRILSNEKLSADIAAAVQDLRVGFLRILRLCRCISQLVSLQCNK